jgi:cyclase
MKTLLRSSILLVALVSFFACGVASAFQVGTTDYTKAETKVVRLRDNLALIQIKTPQDLNNILVLSGPEGFLLVDHPEPAAHALVQAQLDSLGKQPVKFLLNTHWHYDHVGGNEIYGGDATIVAQENVRARLSTAQKPFWSPAPIGPYPAKAWPRITFRDSVTIHFDGDDIEMDHYANGHTDTDSVVYFARANAVDVGDIYNGRGEDLAAGLDMVGIATSLTAVLGHINDETIIVTGHSQPSNRKDLAQYLQILNATIDGVRRDIAAGKTEKEIADAGLPGIWAPWFAPLKFSGGHDFMRAIYGSLQHTNPVDQ